MADVMDGAEPFSADGGPHGVLVLHGFTGNPHSVRPLAEAFADAGFAVELPRLPGHGTSIDDMLITTWADWSGEAEAAYQRLAARCDRVVVAGLSMGGTLTLWVAAEHPEVAGIICINALIEDPGPMREAIAELVESGMEVMDGIGSDIADPDSVEIAYPGTPLRPLQTLIAAGDELRPRLGDITCPALVMTSPQDHVVTPSNSDVLAASVGGPVERVSLDRSYHVATLDYDRDLIAKEAVAFAQRVTG
ncbi:MAG: alpha/beta fold hydrolase [Acidimicrobiia bacterium]|nr:alpha/beta fold hydrolase [Acidimicrobiia bacterium]